MNDMTFILASSSPRRSNLLGLLGIPFSVVPAGIDEVPLDGEEPEAFVLRMARAKTRAVSESRAGSWTLGADTIVVLDGCMMGKPGDENEAADMLMALSGRSHLVLSGVALMNASTRFAADGTARTIVTFRRFGRAEAEAYVHTGEPMDKAGAYGAQGIGALLIERVEGSYSNVVGLPLALVLSMLEGAGILVPSRSGGMYSLKKGG
jgi:septum formation protein